MIYHHLHESTVKKINVVTSGISEHRSVAVGRGNVLIMALVPTCLCIQGPYWLWSHGCWNTAIYVISAYHHWCCQFESWSGQGVEHYVIKFVGDLRQIGGFLRVHRFPPPIKLDRHDIAEILLKVTLSTIKQTIKQRHRYQLKQPHHQYNSWHVDILIDFLLYYMTSKSDRNLN
jgi:hypothetical protein